MELSQQILINEVAVWGYPAMLLLMIIEGPITTIIAAFLSSLGYFNVYAVFLLSVTGDIIGDIILYSIGYFGGRRALLRAEKILNVKQSFVERLEEKFKRHGAKIIFSVKAGTGLCWITFILAGSVKMSFQRFLVYTFWGGIIWSSLLVVIGYFFGYAAETIEQYIKYAGLVIFVAAVAMVVLINLYKKIRTDSFIRKR